jgi:hypothetical protein
MFSDKNYGLPKDLIEAAKRVHEKQLEEGAGKYAEPRIDPKIHKQKDEKVKDILHKLAGREKEEMNKKLPGAKKPQTEEVQFTEEELAEAFAIFLEENFHVEMLTEEDLDYVFEEEFPQWLEEVFNLFSSKQKPSSKTGIRSRVHMGDTGVGGDISTRKYQAQSAVKKAIKSGSLATTGSGQTGIISKMNQDATPDAVKGDTEGGYTSAPKPTARKQVSAKPAASARKRTSAPKGSFTAYRKSLGLGGNLKAAQSERYKKAYRTYRAAKSPKKDWRSSVFNSNN